MTVIGKSRTNLTRGELCAKLPPRYSDHMPSLCEWRQSGNRIMYSSLVGEVVNEYMDYHGNQHFLQTILLLGVFSESMSMCKIKKQQHEKQQHENLHCGIHTDTCTCTCISVLLISSYGVSSQATDLGRSFVQCVVWV